MSLVVESTQLSFSEAGGTTRTVTMPSGLSAGDLLIVEIVSDQNPTHTPPADEGFTELLTPAGGAYDPNAGNVLRKTIWWKEADGGEGASLDWAFSASEPFVACAYRISGWDGTTAPEAEQTDNGGTTTATPDPPSITPSWGSGDEESLFIASFGFDNGNRTFSGTSYPTNYTNGGGQIATGAGGCGLFRAWRLATTATEDPSTFQSLSAADDTLASTIAVRPGAGTTPVSEDLAAVYDVIGRVNESLVAVYDVRAAVNESLVAVYDVRAVVNESLAAVYDVIGQVSEDLVGLYDVIGAASEDLVAQYDVLTPVAEDAVATYDVYALATEDLAALYDVRALATEDLVSVYDIFSGLPPVMPESSGTLVLHVAPTSGNDTTGTGAVGAPYKTINKAWTHASLAAGGIIYLRGNDGEHGNGGGLSGEATSVTVTSRYGSSTDPITMETYPGDPQAVINGTRLHLNPGDLKQNDYNGGDGWNVRIRNIKFTGGSSFGLNGLEAIKSNNPRNFEISGCLFEWESSSAIVIRGMSREQSLAEAVGSGDTDFDVNGTTNLQNATPFYLGITNVSGTAEWNDVREVVKVTNVSGNTLTVERAQFGTSAIAHSTGMKVLGMWRASNVQIFGNIIRRAGMRGTRVNGSQSVGTGDTLTVDDTTHFGATGSLNNTALVVEGIPVAIPYTAKTGTTFTLGTVPGGPYTFDDNAPVLNSWASGHAHGIYYGSDAGADGGAIYNNLVYDCSGFGITLHEEANGTIVAYNTVDYCGRGGIDIAGELTHGTRNCVVTSNIVSNMILRAPIQGAGQSGFAINIWYESVTVDISAYANLVDRTLHYNNVSGYHQTSGSAAFPDVGELTFSNDIASDPLYTDQANADYTIQDGSPAEAAGDPAYLPATDLFGTPRTVADIGAVAGIALALVSEDLVALYDAFALANEDAAAVYDVRALTSEDLVGQYDTFVLATENLAALYDTFVLAVEDLVAVYDARAFVAEDLVAVYDLRAYIAEDLVALYDARVYIAEDLVAVYDTYVLALETLVALYDIFALVNENVVPVYDVRALANEDLVAVYDLRAFISESLDAHYAVLEFGVVGATIIAIYDLRAYVSEDLIAEYTARVLATEDLAAVYDVVAFALANADLDAVYDVFALAVEQLVVTYDVRTVAAAALIAVYHVRALAASGVDITYDLIGRVLATIVASYIVGPPPLPTRWPQAGGTTWPQPEDDDPTWPQSTDDTWE